MRLEPWIALAPVWPALGVLALGALAASGRAAAETFVTRVALWTLSLSLSSTLLAGACLIARGGAPIDLRLGHWFRAADYGFEVALYVDATGVTFAALAALLTLATARFSSAYLHREPGFHRFFALTLVFASGAQLLSLGGSLELLFAGWELVGVASVLLVAFFHERAGPVRAALRVLVTYRVCDVGLVVAAVLLHQTRHSTLFAEVLRGAQGPGAAVALALLVAAMGKSAQFPVGAWLPRAMEGPTASSAVFYGALSVHAGVFLLVRAHPLYAHEPVARAAIALVGLVTALTATATGKVSADAKTALAYATIAQVGVMFIECGAGLPRVALAHLVAHALLRYYQFLRTPSALQDALRRRAALGGTAGDESAARWEGVGLPTRRFLFRLAIERFEVEAALYRALVAPPRRLARALDRIERRIFEGGEGGHG